MDATSWAAASACGLGLGLTGLIPGFHVNTLVALALATGWGGPEVAVALVACASAHGFFSVLPGTYVGVPGDDAALSVLPAHRMAREGQGPAAVKAGIDGVLVATLAAVLLAWPAKWILEEPLHLARLLDAILPWTLAATMAWLALGERAKGWRFVAAALALQLLAAAVGHGASRLSLQGLVAIPAASLFPLFAGMFGVSSLIASLLSADALPQQDRDRTGTRARWQIALASWRGVAASGWTIAVPGLTPGVGASLAYSRRDEDPRLAIAALSATGAAHQVLAIALVFVTLRPRTGLAAGVMGMSDPAAWLVGRPPDHLLDLLAATTAAGLAAWSLVTLLNRPAANAILRLPRRLPDVLALVLVVALVAALTGPLGLALLAVAATVGLVPIAAGLRRVHLVAAVAIPLMAARLGLTP